MPESFLDTLKQRYRQGHQRLLRAVEPLAEEQLHWHPTPVSHSIAFQLWHVSRETDLFQAAIPAMTPELGRALGPGGEVWHMEGLAAAWGLDPAALGPGEYGWNMTDEAAATLPLPAKAVMLEYARRVFALAERAVDAIDERSLAVAVPSGPLGEGRLVGEHLIHWLSHDEWTLGTIAALRRAQGQPRLEP